MGKKQRWQPKQLKINQTKVSDERFEQLLAEVGEVLYKRLRQQTGGVNPTGFLNSTEPTKDRVLGLDKTITKNKVGA